MYLNSEYKSVESGELEELEVKVEEFSEVLEKDESFVDIASSSDGQRLACVIEDKYSKKKFVVAYNKERQDQERGQEHNEIRSLVFSSTGELAYIAGDGKKEFVVINNEEVDDKERVKYDKIELLLFSPDGKHLTYLVRKGEVEFLVSSDIVLEEKQRAKYKRKCVVVDKKEGGEHSDARNLIYSADSKYLAYVAVDDEKEFVVIVDVIDNKEKKAEEKESYGEIKHLLFSEDNKSLTYITINKQEILRKTIKLEK